MLLNLKQFTLQYKTTRSSELMQILAKVRQKSEPRDDEDYGQQVNGDQKTNGFQNDIETET